MRLITANLCMISPGGCLRFTVVSCLFGLGLALMLLLCIPVLQRWVIGVTFMSIAFALYSLAGLCRCKGRLAGLIVCCVSSFDLWQGSQVLFHVLAVFGYIFVSMAPCAQLITYLIRRLKPDWVYDAQVERLQCFCSTVGDYDIICLQEATIFWGLDSHVKQIRDAGLGQGLPYFCSVGRWAEWPATFATNGLAVLSKFPITKVKRFSFSLQSWFEWYIVLRGALMVEVEEPGGHKTAILNVHTTAGLEVLESGVGKRTDGQRANPQGLTQLLEALTLFEQFAQSADHRVLCGDFNIPKDSHAFEVLRAKAHTMGLYDCFPMSPPTFGCSDDPKETLLTRPADFDKPKVLDHVFSDKKCMSAYVEKMQAPAHKRHKFQQVSDHRAVVVSWSQ